MKRKYHYFYKITNLINNHFYYGVHNTDNLDDGYMGSGKRLHYVYKKYGMENFVKEILKFFDTQEEAFEYESEMVTEELVKNPNCYNIALGGKGYCFSGLAHVQDKGGNYFVVPVDDERIKSGELFSSFKNNRILKKIGTNDYIMVNINDVDDYLNNGYVYHTYNKTTVKDKYGNYYQVDKNDPRIISGELVGTFKDRHHTEETKQKISQHHKETGFQKGEKNSQFGTCWITKDGENKKIKKEELESYLNDGWCKGRIVYWSCKKINNL